METCAINEQKTVNSFPNTVTRYIDNFYPDGKNFPTDAVELIEKHLKQFGKFEFVDVLILLL